MDTQAAPVALAASAELDELKNEHAGSPKPNTTPVEDKILLVDPPNSEEDGKDAIPSPKSSKESSDAGIGNFFRLLSYSSRLDKCLMVIGTIASGGAGVALPLMNLIFGRLVGNFNTFSTPGSSSSGSKFISTSNRNSLYIVYLFIARFFLSYISIFAFRMTGIRISARIRLAYLSALFKQPISAIDKLPPGSAADALTTAANTIQMGISDKLAVMIQSIALIIGAYVVAFTRSWQLTLVSSSCILFVCIVYGAIVPIMIKTQTAINKNNEKASGVAGEVFMSIRTVKSLGAENRLLARYTHYVELAKKQGLRISPLAAMHFSPAFFAMYANEALTFWFGIKLYHGHHLKSVSQLIIVLFSVVLVVTSLGGLVGPITGIAKAAAAANSLFKIIDDPQRYVVGLKDPTANATDEIRFENAHFTYPSRPHTAVLKGLNVAFPAGKVTALVGSSGCGKSTTVGLLERWYQLSDVNAPLAKVQSMEQDQEDKKNAKKNRKFRAGKSNAESDETPDSASDRGSPTVLGDSSTPMEEANAIFQNSGAIFLGSHNIETLDLKWWRAQIGLVQQEPYLFDETIFENVERGLINSSREHEPTVRKKKLVEDACREVYADEFIQRLPLGYETRVGESGVKLSGGQRQRLAIARSIVKQPPILILDEATSSIDVRGESIVQAALDRVSKNRTTIMIAHRLSTIRNADQVVVMKEGRMVECGSHQDLVLIDNGVYANLVRAQHLELGDKDAVALDMPKEEIEAKTASSEKTSKDTPIHSEEDYNPRGFFNSLGLFIYEQRQHYPIYILILLSAAGAGAVYAVQAFLFSRLVTVFQYTGSKLVSQGDFWSLMFFILALCVTLFYGVQGYSTNVMSVHVSNDYRKQYFESILRKPLTFYDHEERSSGTLTAQLSNDPQQLQEILGPNLALPLVSVFNIIGCAIIAFIFGWKLALVTFCVALPLILASAFFRIRYEIQFESYNKKVFAESSQFAVEAIRAFRTVAALTLEDTVTNRFDTLLKEQINKAFRTALHAVLVFAFSDSIQLPCMALSFWYGGQLLGKGEYNAAQFFVIYIAVIQGGQAAGLFLGFGPNIANATAAANRILRFRGDTEVPSQSRAIAAPIDGEKRRGMSVQFEHLSFHYPSRDLPVFRDLNISIQSGEYVAFVGPSGCGKSTIINLLCRFYPISSGTVSVDGAPAANIPIFDYRSDVSLVSQEPQLFEGSVKDNLTIGLPNYEDVAFTAIENACKAAQIHDFVVSLPQGYGTPLSSGTHASLSGGQKQRLCIARALLRKPRLLLLDEATSSLDSHSEGLVQAVIEDVAASAEVTVVVVAHRLATVQNAGRIVVLGEGGKILEEGRHADLIKRKGVYWEMCSAQALDR